MTDKTTWTTNEVEYAMAHSGPAPREDAKIALVQFDGSTKTYCYWLLPETAPGNKLVVQSPYSGPTLVTVFAIKLASEYAFVGRLKLAVSQLQFNRMKLAKRRRETSTLRVHAAPPLAPKTTTPEADALQHFGVDIYAQLADQFFGRKYQNPAPFNTIGNPQENSTMNIEITNATFINGTNVKDYTDSQLMGMMQQLDKDIAQLKAMEPLPKRFAKRLEKLEASKKALFELLDSAE